MTRGEVAELLTRILDNYPQFEVRKSTIREWERMLKDESAEEVNANLTAYILKNEWPPKIANLVRKIGEEAYHQELREDTRTRFEQLEEWRKKAVPPTAEQKERMRQIAASRAN